MDNNNIAGEMLEKGQSVATNQVKKLITATQQQITNTQSGAAPDTAKSANASDASQAQTIPGIEQSTKQISTQSIAGSSSSNPLQQVVGSKQKSPLELKQIDDARDRLKLEMHKSNYFIPTFNAPKRQEEPIAEKLEREKQEDLWQKQQAEAKKPEPIAVSRAKRSTEMNRGAGG